MLSPNTFFHISEIHDDFKLQGHVHFVFGDGNCCQYYITSISPIAGGDTIHEVEANGVSPEEWEAVICVCYIL
jgi:hypothetical protein